MSEILLGTAFSIILYVLLGGTISLFAYGCVGASLAVLAVFQSRGWI